ncbi:MAG: phosphoribosyltransferase family protein [Gemmiger sp.]|nr:phosphoribosyltransferase family protein [Gemmiger sp.]
MSGRQPLTGPQGLAGRVLALCFPPRCPLCGDILQGGGGVCLACRPEEARCAHTPPRLPPTEHGFYALAGAASGYYYTGGVRRAILRCKGHGNPWLGARLADLMAVRVFGAVPPSCPGGLPSYTPLPGLPLYDVIVPVPPALGRPRRGYSLPRLLAKRLGACLSIPVAAALLEPTRATRPQKELPQAERFANQKNAYRAAPGGAAEGKRVLLVDDIITTGATASACALALLEGGATSVFAVSVAADEILPPEKQKNEKDKKQDKLE